MTRQREGASLSPIATEYVGSSEYVGVMSGENGGMCCGSEKARRDLLGVGELRNGSSEMGCCLLGSALQHEPAG